MKKTLLALALVGASSTAMADSWIYGGATVGQSDFKGESGTSYSVHAGTGILPIIGIEAGLTQHGTFDIKYSGTKHDTKLRSYYAALKPSIDVGPLHVWAKGGLHQWDKEVTGLSAQDDDGIDIMYGVGAEYFIFGPLSVGASYMNYTIDKDDVGIFSLNATIHLL
ncbi:outer membrane beta-barrel protein [Vibrio navarrensis]|uniref:outer membrane beta-barrel protein n=1 Tax=Vibrio navarrensis TaxID=29495 RepID=UPI00051D9225|nr:outer membrane beta-barrel protein [Vibrio navarrensis]KGK19846.1 membrane protein [Vibrio navarrensis]